MFLVSSGTIALDEDVDNTSLLNPAMFLDSSETSEEFYLLELGDVIVKQYLYD